jgi:hypothetical protein
MGSTDLQTAVGNLRLDGLLQLRELALFGLELAPDDLFMQYLRAVVDKELGRRLIFDLIADAPRTAAKPGSTHELR